MLSRVFHQADRLIYDRQLISFVLNCHKGLALYGESLALSSVHGAETFCFFASCVFLHTCNSVLNNLNLILKQFLGWAAGRSQLLALLMLSNVPFSSWPYKTKSDLYFLPFCSRPVFTDISIRDNTQCPLLDTIESSFTSLMMKVRIRKETWYVLQVINKHFLCQKWGANKC